MSATALGIVGWTPEQEARHCWLLGHITTCTVCHWRNEDDSDGSFCADGARYFADPTYATESEITTYTPPVCAAVRPEGNYHD